MPIPIHAQARKRLIDALANGLPNARVKNGMFLDDITAFMAAYEANSALPFNGALRERIEDYLDDLPFVRFVQGELRDELSRNYEYQSSPDSQPLSELPGYENFPDVAARLVSSFETLPWQFTMTIELPKGLIPDEVLGQQAIAIGAKAKLTKYDLLMSGQYPQSHANAKVAGRGKSSSLFLSLLGGNSPNGEWTQDSCYFQMEDDGYVGIYGGGNVVDRAVRDLESFLGLGLSMRLLNYSYKYDNPDTKSVWTVHRYCGDAWELSTRFSLDSNVADAIRHITSFKFASDYPQESRTPWLKGAIERVGRVFSADGNATLKLAAKWFFDSYKGNDETLEYIRMMTALEILLGERADTSKSSLGEILGNRLAYLIGKSAKERSNILTEFKNIYGLRSSILHHGKHRIRGDERKYITTLRTYCERAIEEEARLLLAS